MKGDDIVKAFMAEYRIGTEDLFRSRFAEHTTLREKCIRRLRGAGVGVNATARAMQCDAATIRYWMDRDWRISDLGRRMGHYPVAKKFRTLALALEVLHA